MNRIKELQAKYEAAGEVDWKELALVLLAEYQAATESLAESNAALAKAATSMRVWKARYEHQKEVARLNARAMRLLAGLVEDPELEATMIEAENELLFSEDTLNALNEGVAE